MLFQPKSFICNEEKIKSHPEYEWFQRSSLTEVQEFKSISFNPNTNWPLIPCVAPGRVESAPSDRNVLVSVSVRFQFFFVKTPTQPQLNITLISSHF